MLEAVAGEGGPGSPTARSDDPDAAELVTAARAALRAKTGAAQTVRGNRVSAGRLRLCLGRDPALVSVRAVGPGLGAQRLAGPPVRPGP